MAGWENSGPEKTRRASISLVQRHLRIGYNRAARLIAAGLMPLNGLKPDVTLQFHIAAVLLEERILEAPELVHALDEMLGTMSSRTRRPIRFLEPEVTLPVPMDSESSLLESDSVPPSPPLAPAPPAMAPGLSRSASRP